MDLGRGVEVEGEGGIHRGVNYCIEIPTPYQGAFFIRSTFFLIFVYEENCT